MSTSQAAGFPTFALGRKTQTAGTVINRVVKRHKNKKAKITALGYLCAGTAHTLTFLAPLTSFAKVVGDVAAGGTSVVLDRDPGNYSAWATSKGEPTPSVTNNLIAASDIIILHTADGLPQVILPSAATTNTDGTVTLTIAAAPTGGYKNGETCYFYGLITDTHPVTGEAHMTELMVVSILNSFAYSNGSVFEAYRMNEPIIVQSSNATAAGEFVTVNGVYADA